MSVEVRECVGVGLLQQITNLESTIVLFLDQNGFVTDFFRWDIRCDSPLHGNAVTRDLGFQVFEIEFIHIKMILKSKLKISGNPVATR